jgi:hypothetical protein
MARERILPEIVHDFARLLAIQEFSDFLGDASEKLSFVNELNQREKSVQDTVSVYRKKGVLNSVLITPQDHFEKYFNNDDAERASAIREDKLIAFLENIPISKQEYFDILKQVLNQRDSWKGFLAATEETQSVREIIELSGDNPCRLTHNQLNYYNHLFTAIKPFFPDNIHATISRITSLEEIIWIALAGISFKRNDPIEKYLIQEQQSKYKLLGKVITRINKSKDIEQRYLDMKPRYDNFDFFIQKFKEKYQVGFLGDRFNTELYLGKSVQSPGDQIREVLGMASLCIDLIKGDSVGLYFNDPDPVLLNDRKIRFGKLHDILNKGSEPRLLPLEAYVMGVKNNEWKYAYNVFVRIYLWLN